MPAALRKNWGFAAFAAFSLIALARLLLQETPGHYLVFTGAARAIWSGENPYGSTFGTGVGYYFYSPSCALFFFGIFHWMPRELGILAYMGLSWAVFVAGALAFARAYVGSTSPASGRLVPFPKMNWFWLMVSAQMVGGVLASKLEIAMTGILLLCLSWLSDLTREGALSRKGLGAAFLLSMILNWKFQPLPTLGLVCLAWLWTRKDWKWPATLALFTGFWFAAPYAIVSRALLAASNETWRATFSGFVAEAFLNFENIHAFLRNSLGLVLSFPQSQALSAGFALLLAGVVSAALFRRSEAEHAWKESLVLAAGLGAMYTAVFSPLGQNNALILYAPLLLGGFLCLESSTGRWKSFWIVGLAAVWSLMTLPYSDLVPLHARELLRHLTIKPLGPLFLAAILGSYYFEKKRQPFVLS